MDYNDLERAATAAALAPVRTARLLYVEKPRQLVRRARGEADQAYDRAADMAFKVAVGSALQVGTLGAALPAYAGAKLVTRGGSRAVDAAKKKVEAATATVSNAAGTLLVVGALGVIGYVAVEALGKRRW